MTMMMRSLPVFDEKWNWRKSGYARVNAKLPYKMPATGKENDYYSRNCNDKTALETSIMATNRKRKRECLKR
jgi:hypothetical protein